jgi:hypothetical protein
MWTNQDLPHLASIFRFEVKGKDYILMSMNKSDVDNFEDKIELLGLGKSAKICQIRAILDLGGGLGSTPISCMFYF